MPEVTPGKIWQEGETVTIPKLNETANPLVAFTDEDKADLAEAVLAGASGINWFQNPDLRSWTLGTTVALGVETWTERADAWEAYATYTDGVGAGTGASPSPTTHIVYARVDDVVHTNVLYAAQFTGETNGASVRFGQKLSGQVAAGMLENKATITVEVENKTGASQVVTVIFESCNSFENYGATTERYSAPLGTLANNTRATYTHTIDLSAAASQVRKGGRLFIKMPGLNGGSKQWIFYYAKLEPGETASARRIERDPIQKDASSAGSSDAREFLRNGDFSQWLTDSATCAEDLDTFVAEAWGVVPADGSDAAYARVVDSPDTKTLYAARITGAASVSTTVDFVQDIPRPIAAELRGTVVFAISIYNGTGVAFVPDFRLDTCDAENSVARTNRIGQPLDLCADGAWTRVQWSFNGSTATNLANGARLGIRIPSGSLNAGGKSVRFAQASLRYGSEAATFAPEPVRAPTPNARPTAADIRGLRISKDSDTTIAVAAGAFVAQHADGGLLPVHSLSTTIDITTTGADGLDAGTATLEKWYHIYLIANGEQSAALLHREDDADGPLTLPTGYQWAAGPVGAVRLDASAHVPPFVQTGQWCIIFPKTIRDAVPGTQDILEQVTVADVDIGVPMLADGIMGTLGVSNNIACRVAIAPMATNLGRQQISQAAAGAAWNEFNGGAAPFNMPIVAPQEVYVMADTTTMKICVSVTGFHIP